MSWGMVAGAAVSAVAGYSKKKSAQKDAEAQQGMTLEQIAASSTANMQEAAFGKELDYYYGQLEKQERMRGLDEYRKFSTVNAFAPGYQNTNPGPVVPSKPIAGPSSVTPKEEEEVKKDPITPTWHKGKAPDNNTPPVIPLPVQVTPAGNP